MPRLYELKSEYMTLANELCTDDVDAQKTLALLQYVGDEIDTKIVSLAKLVRNLQSDVDAIKSEENRLYELRKSKENAVANIKAHMKSTMDELGLDRVSDPIIIVSLRNNPASTDIPDESVIPYEYRIPQPDKIDRKKILEVLKNGTEVAGASLHHSKSITIR